MEKNDEYDIAGAEVCDFLNNIPKQKYDKIPQKIKDLFSKYQNLNIGTRIDLSKSYEEQGISQKTKDMIFVLMYNYWLTNDEKQNVLQQMKINEEKAKEQYNIEKIFRQRQNNNLEKQIINKEVNTILDNNDRKNINEPNKVMVKTKEGIIERVINFFKRIFKK